MPYIVGAFLLFALIMGGLTLVLNSKKLWSGKNCTWRERVEPKAIIGFVCMAVGIGVILSFFHLLTA